MTETKVVRETAKWRRSEAKVKLLKQQMQILSTAFTWKFLYI